MKVLITGDREWTSIDAVISEFTSLPKNTTIIHGACKGADNICAAVAEKFNFDVIPYPADWLKYGKAAGPIRNQQMINEENVKSDPINLCLAFHDDITSSRGTRDMILRAAKAGIEIRLVRTKDVL